MTIISESRRFVFVHIPKTGGTTIKWLLSPSLDSKQDIQIGGPPGFTSQANGTILRKHSKLEEVRACFREDKFDSYFKFSMVRNPYARAMSAYRFLKYKFRAFPNADVMDSFSTVDEFILSDFFRRTGPSGMFSPQIAWLNTAHSSDMDYLGHVENFEESVTEILRRLDVKARKLERRNSSPAEDVDACRLSEAAVETIQNRYARDFRELGYSLDPADCMQPPALMIYAEGAINPAT